MSALAAKNGAINLSQGFPDFNIDPELISLVNKEMKAGHNQYAPMPGVLSLREAISEKTEKIYNSCYNPETEITITAGGTQAIYTAIATIIRPNDEAIIFEPAYDCYAPTIKAFGGLVKAYEMEAPHYEINWDMVKKLVTAKAAYFSSKKVKATATASNLKYVITKKGTGIKGAEGSTIYFHYAGYFEDGTLFDSSIAEVARAYGKYDPNRDAQGGYKAFPFTVGKKDGMIPGFIEALDMMTDGEKAIFFLPSNLAYGEKGAGGVIPPNTSLIFEIETSQTQQ